MIDCEKCYLPRILSKEDYFLSNFSYHINCDSFQEKPKVHLALNCRTLSTDPTNIDYTRTLQGVHSTSLVQLTTRGRNESPRIGKVCRAGGERDASQREGGRSGLPERGPSSAGRGRGWGRGRRGGRGGSSSRCSPGENALWGNFDEWHSVMWEHEALHSANCAFNKCVSLAAGALGSQHELSSTSLIGEMALLKTFLIIPYTPMGLTTLGLIKICTCTYV